MPSYPLTFPTLQPLRVRVSQPNAVAAVPSPFTFQQKVYVHAGRGWVIDVTMQEMTATSAALMTQFLYDLQGRRGTFSFDLDPWCPGLAPAPGVLPFRLADNDPGWDSDLASTWEFSFRAEQAQ